MKGLTDIFLDFLAVITLPKFPLILHPFPQCSGAEPWDAGGKALPELCPTPELECSRFFLQPTLWASASSRVPELCSGVRTQAKLYRPLGFFALCSVDVPRSPKPEHIAEP